MSDEEEPTFETELVLNAFYSLMPTANRISQFLMLAEGQDFETLREAYPELLGDKKTSTASTLKPCLCKQLQ